MVGEATSQNREPGFDLSAGIHRRQGLAPGWAPRRGIHPLRHRKSQLTIRWPSRASDRLVRAARAAQPTIHWMAAFDKGGDGGRR